MHVREFERINQEFWTKYLKNITAKVAQGVIELDPGQVLLYPSLMLITQTEKHYVVELAGVSPTYVEPLLKRSKHASINSYFGSADEGQPWLVASEDNSLRSFSVATDSAWDKFTRDYPNLQDVFPTRLRCSGQLERTFDLSNANYLHLGNLLNLHDYGPGGLRVRYIAESLSILQTEEVGAYKAFLENLEKQSDVFGVIAPEEGESRALTQGLTLVNAYMIPHRETTLGDFLRLHQTLLLKALGGRNLIAQPNLRWIDGHSGGDTSIQPDLLIQRVDGYWDICDLKLPLFKNRSLTKNQRRRRQVISPVDEGLAQLAHYEEYFTTRANAALALEKYGIEVKDPRKILIIGNQYNYNAIEIDEALRHTRRSFDILNFDALLWMYLAAEGFTLPRDRGVTPQGWSL